MAPNQFEYASNDEFVITNNDGRYHIYRNLGGIYWQRMQFTDNNLSNGPLSWNETTIEKRVHPLNNVQSIQSQLIQPYGSQLEYAYMIDNSIVGGIHGNEKLENLRWYIDGEKKTVKDGGRYAASKSIELQQIIYAEIDGDAVAFTTLIHRIDSSGVTVSHAHEWLDSFDVGWYYAHMWPLIGINGADIITLGVDTYVSTDYWGVHKFEGRTETYDAAFTGGIFNGEIQLNGSIEFDPIGVNSYQDARATKASVEMNRYAASDSSTQFLNKLYFERTSNNYEVSVASGDIWTATAVYKLSIE